MASLPTVIRIYSRNKWILILWGMEILSNNTFLKCVLLCTVFECIFSLLFFYNSKRWIQFMVTIQLLQHVQFDCAYTLCSWRSFLPQCGPVFDSRILHVKFVGTVACDRLSAAFALSFIPICSPSRHWMCLKSVLQTSLLWMSWLIQYLLNWYQR